MFIAEDFEFPGLRVVTAGRPASEVEYAVDMFRDGLAHVRFLFVVWCCRLVLEIRLIEF